MNKTTITVMAADARIKRAYNKYRRLKYKIRRDVLKDLVGDTCVVCGSNDNIHYDHVNRSDLEIQTKRLRDVSWKRFLNEVPKLQPLCEVCHGHKTAKEVSKVAVLDDQLCCPF